MTNAAMTVAARHTTVINDIIILLVSCLSFFASAFTWTFIKSWTCITLNILRLLFI